jgi:hypothetical protein
MDINSIEIPDGWGWLFCHNRLFDWGEIPLMLEAYYSLKRKICNAFPDEEDLSVPHWILEPVAWIPESVCPSKQKLSLVMSNDYWKTEGGWSDKETGITVLSSANPRSLVTGDVARDPNGHWWIALDKGWRPIRVRTEIEI